MAKRRTTNAAGWTRLQYLEHTLAELERVAAEASADGTHGAAVRAIERSLLVRQEIDKIRAVEAAETIPEGQEAHRDELLVEIRRERLAATAKGSHVAAATLLRLELDLVDRMPAPPEPERRSAEEVLEGFAARIEALPELWRVRLLRRLQG